MTYERFLQLMNADYPNWKEYIDKDTIILGLNILRKYVPNVRICAAEHGVIFVSASINELIEANITEEDVITLNDMLWHIEDDGMAYHL
jgi:2-polyprenyl-3-methyl-5-hydroxy-6-metoxy-1,4-benzoquinol methylase